MPSRADERGAMEEEAKGQGAMKRILLICMACLLLTGCTGGKPAETDGEHGVMNIDLCEDGLCHNGTAFERYLLEAGKRGVLSMRIARKSGRLDMEIYPAGQRDAPLYRGRELDSAEFEVIVTRSGEYRVCITAEDFVGDYEIGWRCAPATEQ